jgi:hypothetical protein
MVDCKSKMFDHFMHAGAGTSILLAYAGLIPGVIPLLGLTLLVTAVALLPFLAFGLVAGAVAAPPYAAWRVISRFPRRHGHGEV